MLYGPGLRLSQIHDKLRLAKDKKFIPLVNILPNWLLPNHVTAFRSIILLIWFPFAIIHPNIFQIIIFVFIYFLDLLDGAIARLRNEETYFGEYFDQVSDKFNNIAFLFLLYGLTNNQFAILKVFIWWDVIIAALLVIEFILKLKNKEIFYIKEPLDQVIKLILWIFIIFRIAPILL